MTGTEPTPTGSSADQARLLHDLTHPDPGVRTAAAVALGELGEGGTIPARAEALNDREWSVRLAVVEALGRIGGPRAIPPLMDALTDPNEQVRAAATFGLAE